MTDECPDITRALARLASFRGTNENDGEKKSRTRLYDTKPQPEKIAAKKTRTCLTCGKKFLSEGPGNHVCNKCKSGHLWKNSAGTDFDFS